MPGPPPDPRETVSHPLIAARNALEQARELAAEGGLDTEEVDRLRRGVEALLGVLGTEAMQEPFRQED
jgi:hypothetical protein